MFCSYQTSSVERLEILYIVYIKEFERPRCSEGINFPVDVQQEPSEAAIRDSLLILDFPLNNGVGENKIQVSQKEELNY